MDRRDVRDQLKRQGIRPTAQRVALAELVFARPQHLSADQLMTMARREGVRVSKATVYNTLNLFAERGLIREVLVDPERTFYDSNVHHHHHFYNVDTGELIDVPADCVSFDNLPELPGNTEAEGIDVVIRIRGNTSHA